MKSRFCITPLGDIFDVTSSKRVLKKQWRDSGVPFYRAREIVKLAEHGSVENSLFIDEDHYSELEGNFGVPKAGDMMVSAVGTLGACYIVQPHDRFYFKDASVLRFAPKIKVDCHFIKYSFKNNFVANQIHSSAGTTVATFTISRARRTQIPLPPLEDQRRIVEILDAAQALIDQRKEQLGLMDQLVQSLFYEMFGDPVTNPMGWEIAELGSIVSDTKLGLVRSSKEFGWDFRVPYVRMDSISKDGRFLSQNVQMTEADAEEISLYELFPGDLLFNTRNSKELVGKVCIYRGSRGAVFNNNIMRMRFLAGIEPRMVAAQFQTQFIQHELEKRKKGTTSVFAIYWKTLRTLPLMNPNAELQTQFAERVEAIEGQKAAMAASLVELETTFQALMQRAFKGELTG